MKLILIGFSLVLSLSALADFVEVKGSKGEALKADAMKSLYSYMNKLRFEEGEHNCYMAEGMGFGATYVNHNGIKVLRELFFMTPAGTDLTTRIYTDASSGRVMFTQDVASHSNNLIIQYENVKVVNAKFVVDAGFSDQIIVNCL